MARTKPAEAPARLFANQKAWEGWLHTNHRQHPGIWLRLAKKNSGVRSVSYAEALEVALCFGWIDGQKKSGDTQTWLQKFVPRSERSIWSKINREKAEALIRSERMRPAGAEAIERAKANGRWQAAYDSPSRSSVSRDFKTALAVSRRAEDFFQQLDSANRYAILFRIQTAKKPETRARKIREFIAMLERNETIHPRRAGRSRK